MRERGNLGLRSNFLSGSYPLGRRALAAHVPGSVGLQIHIEELTRGLGLYRVYLHRKSAPQVPYLAM